MLLLALDTATPAVTAAVHDGERVLSEHTVADARRHGELLAPQIEAALADAGVTAAELTAIAVGVGPGPFTGLRVGVVTGLVLGRTLGIGVHGVCTLDVLAAQAVRDVPGLSSFVVATDARRREVHWATYDLVDGRAVRRDGPATAAAGEVPREGRPVVGRGSDLYAEALGPRVGPVDPAAGVLAAYAVEELAAGRELLRPEPLYLRRPDATPPAQPKRVLS